MLYSLFLSLSTVPYVSRDMSGATDRYKNCVGFRFLRRVSCHMLDYLTRTLDWFFSPECRGHTRNNIVLTDESDECLLLI